MSTDITPFTPPLAYWAGITHARFASIRPFTDGNGKAVLPPEAMDEWLLAQEAIASRRSCRECYR